jgi:hypothetical protein
VVKRLLSQQVVPERSRPLLVQNTLSLPLLLALREYLLCIYYVLGTEFSLRTSNAAMGTYSVGLSNSVLTGLASVAASIFVGAWITV